MAHLTIRGLRDILDDYAANRYRRTDRPYINGWMIACMFYDRLLADFAAIHHTAVPARHHLGRAWSDEDRTRAEQALTEMGWPVRPTDSHGRPLPPAIIWGRERLSARAAALATLAANVSAGALDHDVLAIEIRCDAASIRPARATGRVTVVWHAVTCDIEERGDQVGFDVVLSDGDRLTEAAGTVHLDPDKNWWDLTRCAITPDRTREAVREESQELQL
ncbi:MAG: hypothetical protein ACR2HR_16450 [Euzebya sp.]